MFDILIAAFATGMFVKVVDDIEGRPMKWLNRASVALGGFYGLLISYVMLRSALVANLWMAVVLGNLIAGKIDSPGHRSGLFSMLVTVSIFGFPKFEPALLAVFIAAAYADEFFKGLSDRKKFRSGFFSSLVSHRVLSEVAAFVVSFYTTQWLLFASIFAFDAGYLLTSRINWEKILIMRFLK